MTTDFELMLRLKTQFANSGMEALINDTQKLVDKYSYEGAEDFLHWQLKILRDLQSDEEDTGDDDAMGYREDAAKSLWAFDNVVAPALKKIFGAKRIFSTENHDSGLEKFLDQETGIDALIVSDDGTTYPAACRIQFGKCYESFTLRRSRPSGAPTEYDKLNRAKKVGGLMPTYHVQAFIDGANDKAKVAIAETVDLLKYIDGHASEWRKTSDGETFFVIPWYKMDKVKTGYVDLSRNQ